MNSHKPFCLFLIFLLIPFCLSAQNIDAGILNKRWKAFWIAVPNEPANGYGVYHFKKEFDLAAKPSSFVIHASADNRYKLYVNGNLVSLGPARGDIFHWNFEMVEIASHLQAGKNTIIAIVWNDGELKPEAQISYRTAFILQGNTSAEEIVNTNNGWQCRRDKSYQPLHPELIFSYYVAGPGELIDMHHRLSDTSWLPSQQLFNGVPKGVFDYTTGWMLIPRSIPQSELIVQRLHAVRKTDIQLPSSFPQTKVAVTIPAHTKTTILLDQAFLTNAYPTIIFSSGNNAVISLKYAEALYINEGDKKDWRAQHQKGNRDEGEGKRFVGKEDRIISNGDQQQHFTSLWWRTYRYLQLQIETKNQPLVIDDIYGTATGYPFKMNANFKTSDTGLSKIMEVGWRTAKLCAFETYMDCPYYEQLQYVGDTRIQALVSLYNSGDDMLIRNAITLLDDSRLAEGATMSRYPTANHQEIPTFSLWWIGMLHDYWMYRPDADFVKNKLPGERQVLSFYSKYQQADGSLKNPPYWNFTDWVGIKGWHNGMAPVGKNGNSAALDLQLLWAYQIASEMENKLGMQEFAKKYKTAADQLQQTIRKKYWDASKKLFSDTPDKDVFSQHTNSLAILTGTVMNADATLVAKKILTDTSLTQATIYFKYYVHQALTKAGYGNDYLNWLDIWHENLNQGMTTWAEISDINNARSDCHAWGSHPNIEFFRIVLGIDTDEPGFSKVKIEPHLGTLKNAGGDIPHPNGKIAVDYNYENNKWNIKIDLPKNTTGTFIWKNKQYPLKSGVNNFNP
ncbi:MAG TPA: alpha-L-rhamnosidase C-terminal domain-containing protein [Chitinophagaceae bacterium]|nr:alpha-L-rhamnosidase C-terminal domain-containing protein [Chitinophagaceae bacterium]